jgi:predicted MFS family arabinose efflux permease
LDVGFYYMANAIGRLLGTLLSGWVYQSHGLQACLWLSSGLLTLAVLVTYWLKVVTPVNRLE